MYSRVPPVHRTLRFDAFHVDLHSRELRQEGARIPLQDVPFSLLAALLERPGQVRSHEELRQEIWPPEVHLDFDGALATAARKVRLALGDSSQTPLYIETLPGRGYRFIGDLSEEETPSQPKETGQNQASNDSGNGAHWKERRHPPPAYRRVRGHLLGSLVGVGLFLPLMALAYRRQWPPFPAHTPPIFRRLSGGEAEVYGARLLHQNREVVLGVAWNGGPVRMTRIDLTSLEKVETGIEGHPLAVGPDGQTAVALRPRRTRGSFGTFQGTLALGPLSGGAPRELLKTVFFADFTPSGELAVVRRVGGSFRLESPPGTLLLESPNLLGHPRFSPDGKSLAFLEGSLGGRVMLMDVATKGIRTLTGEYRFVRGLAWRGNEVWFTAGIPTQTDLLAVTRQGRVRVVYKGTTRFLLYDIGPDGRVLLGQSEVQPEVLVWEEGQEQARVPERRGHFWLRDISRDGRQVLGWHLDGQGRHHAVAFPTNGDPPLDLPGGGLGQSISPDGKWLATLFREPEVHLALLPLGIGEARKIPLQGIQPAITVRWMPDGKRILFTGSEPGRLSRVFLQSTEGGPPRPLTPEGAMVGTLPSPDGRQVMVETEETSLLVDLGAIPSGLQPIPALQEGERVAGWTEDARGLYLYRPGTAPLRIWKVDLNRGTRTLWRTCTAGAQPGAHLDNVLVSADGSRVFLQSYRNPESLYLAEGLR